MRCERCRAKSTRPSTTPGAGASASQTTSGASIASSPSRSPAGRTRAPSFAMRRHDDRWFAWMPKRAATALTVASGEESRHKLCLHLIRPALLPGVAPGMGACQRTGIIRTQDSRVS